ncbi:MAG: hypothetical protein IKN72_01755 [Clostridia bacterium]|nr:hypothetical protein [Clostridia bacterium]
MVIKMGNSAFVPNVGRLQSFDYQGIVQALITRTDNVWLQALTLDANESEMVHKIEELLEAELVKLWDYEIPLSHTKRKIDRVITLDEHNSIEKCKEQLVDEMIKASRLSTFSDYTIVNIERKNIITNQLLAECCGTTSIIQRYPGNFINNSSNGRNSCDELIDLYAPYLFGRTKMGNLSNMSIDDILELRKLSKYFRKKIQEYADKHMFSLIPESEIKRDCEAIHEEYENLVREAVRDKYASNSVGGGIVLEIFSCFVNWVSFISIPQKIIASILNRNERGFIMYMSRLSQTVS